jgi:16S rRNA (cytosine967-C5)-methyltransferase
VRDGARIAAAIEVLDEIDTRHRPVRLALKAWGDGARYAGAKDRAFVSGLVLDVLRRKRSLSWRFGADTNRARALGALSWDWGWTGQQIASAFEQSPHGPGALSADEVARLSSAEASFDVNATSDMTARAGPRMSDHTDPALQDAPFPVRGDYPDWLDGALARIFGDMRAAEGAALARRAPVDLRVNTLKTDPARARRALENLGAVPDPWVVNALSVPAPAAAERASPVESAPEFAKGWFEVQDRGSQIAASAAGDIKGRQVLDLCAGGGGKTLALAAAMTNSGQLFAFDAEARRLSDTVVRGQRAGLRNLQVRSPLRPDALFDLTGRMDVVFVDAPCTGTGTWRRHPDAKWRLAPNQLERRMAEQDAVLTQAAGFVRPGGRLVYVTCSVLAEENEDRVSAFLAARTEFSVAPALDVIAASGQLTPLGLDALRAHATAEGFVRLTPASARCDGFFIAVLIRDRNPNPIST